MNIGPTIKLLRQKAGLTQAQLAEGAGISRMQVSRLEADRQSPTLEVFIRIAATLKTTPSKLLAWIEKSN